MGQLPLWACLLQPALSPEGKIVWEASSLGQGAASQRVWPGLGRASPPPRPTPCSPCFRTQACSSSLPILPGPLLPSHSSAIPLHADGCEPPPGPGRDHPLSPLAPRWSPPPPLPVGPQAERVRPAQTHLPPAPPSSPCSPQWGLTTSGAPPTPRLWDSYCRTPPGTPVPASYLRWLQPQNPWVLGKALGSACQTAVCHRQGGLDSSLSAPGRP